MKKIALILCLFLTAPAYADKWSNFGSVKGIIIGEDGAFSYETTASFVNIKNCPLSRYSVSTDHPARDYLFTQIVLAWKNNYKVATKVSSKSCMNSGSRVASINVNK